MTDVTGEPGSRSWRLDLPLVGRQIDFVAAGRHTARVRFLRCAIVVVAALGTLLLSVFAVFNPLKHLSDALSVAGVGVEGTQITINAPKLSGFRKDGQPYEVTARAGVQDITVPNIVRMLDVDAKLGMVDRSTTRVTAATAVYDSKTDSMTLDGTVRITNPTGYDMSVKSAAMDFKTGGLVSNDAVKVVLDGATVTADRMEVTDDGHHVAFEGNVRSLVQPSDPDGPSLAGAEPRR
jgi:lipopolysaccharide export system protein LptC